MTAPDAPPPPPPPPNRGNKGSTSRSARSKAKASGGGTATNNENGNNAAASASASAADHNNNSNAVTKKKKPAPPTPTTSSSSAASSSSTSSSSLSSPKTGIGGGGGGGTVKEQSNVRVVGRIRPLAGYEIERGCRQVIRALPGDGKGGPEQLSVEEHGHDVNGSENDNKRWFELDAVLDGNSTQQSVYEKSGARRSVTHDLFRGFNCTILAYGQTGAGKTFTMGTAPSETAKITETCGIIPRAVVDLFDAIQEKCDGNAKVELSYLEVYNEEIRDLMTDTQTPLRIRENLDGEVYVRGLQAVPVASPSEIGKCMQQASNRRVVASTKMNAVSSRSHAICVLRIQGVLEDSTKFQSKLTLVDLAGSERIKKTGAQGDRAQEGISINKGLFVLGQVVSALAEQRPKFQRKPPYRDSKLTRLLQDSLGGNSRTIMVACVSPADFNVEESINTLRYATSARNIKNTATRNVVQNISPEEAAKLRRENDLLKQQVKELESMVEKLTTDLEEAVEGHLTEGLNDLIQDEQPESSESGLAAFLKTGGAKKSYEELEEENKRLKNAIQKRDTDMVSLAEQSVALKSMAESAVELPDMKKKCQLLEDELNESKLFFEEADHLRSELEQTKAEAQAARHAANKLSKELSRSQRNLMANMSNDDDDEYSNSDEEEDTRQPAKPSFTEDDRRLEFTTVAVNEEWVNFVVSVYRDFREQMRQLGDFYSMVVTIVNSPDISTMLPPQMQKPRKGFWGGGIDAEKEKLERRRQEMELRQKLLSEHIQFFNDKFLETEDNIMTRVEGLDEIQEYVKLKKEALMNSIAKSGGIPSDLMMRANLILKRLSTLLEIELGDGAVS